LIVIAAQENGKGIGRIRLARIPDASAQSLRGFIRQAIEPGSRLHTDGWQGYAGLESPGYGHEVTVIRGRGKAAATELLPRVHLVASLLKRWLLGTHQGSFGMQHVDYYLDEFTFRFNRRTSRSRGKLFFRLVEQAVAAQSSPYKNMVGGVPGTKTETPQVVLSGVN
jgi:transposase-like protein